MSYKIAPSKLKSVSHYSNILAYNKLLRILHFQHKDLTKIISSIWEIFFKCQGDIEASYRHLTKLYKDIKLNLGRIKGVEATSTGVDGF